MYEQRMRNMQQQQQQRSHPNRQTFNQSSSNQQSVQQITHESYPQSQESSVNIDRNQQNNSLDYMIQNSHLQYFNHQESEKQKVLIFYKSLLQQHQDSQKLSLITLQIVKIMNYILNLKPLQEEQTSSLVKELFNLLNILIYPQRLKLNSQLQQLQDNYDSQQEKVRDIILYLKVIKQVLKLTDEKDLFTISDIIDENNLNCQVLIYHFMVIFEQILGKHTNKIERLSAYEVLELQRDLEPLVQHVQTISNGNNSQLASPPRQAENLEQQKYQQDLRQLETTYYTNLKKLENKLKAYKQEYVKVKTQQKYQEKVIKKYEEVFKQLGQKRESKTKEQEIKNQIFEKFLNSLKSNYEQELSNLKQHIGSDQVNDINHNKSRSISPIGKQSSSSRNQLFMSKENSQVQTEIQGHSKFIQTDDDPRIQELEELQVKYTQVSKEREQLTQDKKDLLLEKHKNSEQYSEIKQKFEGILEELDEKTQKYQNIKKELKRIQEEGGNNEIGMERFKDEIQLLQKQKLESENRTKKFETQYRQALKEINELKEMLELQKTSQNRNNKEQLDNRDDDFNGSEGSSFMIFNPHQQNEMRLQELERERDILFQKVQLLEKSNKELLYYKKSLEETFNEISKEEDPQKKINMINVNVIRRKSLLRLESQFQKETKVLSPDKLQTENKNTFIGQRQSVMHQFQPGAKNSLLTPPSRVTPKSPFNQDNEQLQSINNNQEENNNSTHHDFERILDQIDHDNQTNPKEEKLQKQEREEPEEPEESKINTSQSQEVTSRTTTQQEITCTETDQAVANLFGLATNDRTDLLAQFQNKSSSQLNQEQNEEESEQEEDQDYDKSNFLLQKLKQTAQKMVVNQAIKQQNSSLNKSLQKDIPKQVINEENNEDEYDDEEESSSSESSGEYD